MGITRHARQPVFPQRAVGNVSRRSEGSYERPPMVIPQLIHSCSHLFTAFSSVRGGVIHRLIHKVRLYIVSAFAPGLSDCRGLPVGMEMRDWSYFRPANLEDLLERHRHVDIGGRRPGGQSTGPGPALRCDRGAVGSAGGMLLSKGTLSPMSSSASVRADFYRPAHQIVSDCAGPLRPRGTGGRAVTVAGRCLVVVTSTASVGRGYLHPRGECPDGGERRVLRRDRARRRSCGAWSKPAPASPSSAIRRRARSTRSSTVRRRVYDVTSDRTSGGSIIAGT